MARPTENRFVHIDLVRKAVAGDGRAFEQLSCLYRRTLLNHAYRYVHNSEDASDIVQDAFLKAFRNISDFDVQKPMLPWLCRICTNCAIDFLRRQQAPHMSLDEESSAQSASLIYPSEAVEWDLIQDDLQNAVQHLPQPYRRIIVMRHFQDKEVTQIALELQRPEGTVKSWLFRGRAMLKADFAAYTL